MRPAAAVAAAAVISACGAGPEPVEPTVPARCPAEPTVIASQADADAFPRCPISLGVAIRTGGALALETSALRHLRQIETGDLVIGPSIGLEGLELADLVEVQGTIKIVGNGSLVSVAFPRLIRAGNLVIEGNVELRVVAVPALAEIGQDLVIDRTPELAMVDAGALHTIAGELAITDAPVLTVLEAGSLVRAAGVRLTRTGLDPEARRALEAISSPSE